MSIAMSPSRPAAVLSPRRLAGLLRVSISLGMLAALGFAAAVALAVTIPTLALGYHSLTVLSGSMAPTIDPGDLVVDSRISPLEARVGDVVTFTDPSRARKLVTHRVRAIDIRGATAYFVTRGDANTGVERWSIPVDGTLGRVEFRIPKLGYVTVKLGDRVGRIALVAFPALLFCVFELLQIWRPAQPRRRRPDNAMATLERAHPPARPSGETVATAHPTSHLLVFSTADGHQRRECRGVRPTVGSLVILDSEPYVVVRIAQGPLPADPRPCAFLVPFDRQQTLRRSGTGTAR